MARTQKITTHLWFNGNAEAAVEFYTSVFPDLKVTNIARWGDGGPGPQGAVLNIAFEMAGQSFLALNGGPQYPFTPAISLFVTCESQAEVDELSTKFLDGGGNGEATTHRSQIRADTARRPREHLAVSLIPVDEQTALAADAAGVNERDETARSVFHVLPSGFVARIADRAHAARDGRAERRVRLRGRFWCPSARWRSALRARNRRSSRPAGRSRT